MSSVLKLPCLWSVMELGDMVTETLPPGIYVSTFQNTWGTNIPIGLNDHLQTVINKVRVHLNDYVNDKPISPSMGSTLAMAKFYKDCIMVAWVGDSRVYHIRNGKVLYHTKDHSLVQNLVDIGRITSEEARLSPKRNIIMNYFNVKDKSILVDFNILEDIRKDDYLMICSDGVWENFQETKLSSRFQKRKKVTEIKNAIENDIENKMKDNASAIFIKVKHGISPKKRLQKFVSTIRNQKR